MTANEFKAPIGTKDIFPPESVRWQQLIAIFGELVTTYGYGLLQTPMFEDIGVFQRMGAGTDVVTKEMYEFVDKGGRHNALRPEGTASAVRAFVEHHPLPPWKIWYAAPNFRYERPQKGRLRQHHQLGVECLGVSDPDLDVEMITLLWRFYERIGLRNISLQINSIGDKESRAAYTAQLRTWLMAHSDRIDARDREKIAEHPLRVLDSKSPQTQEVIVDAPQLDEALTPHAQAHFARVQSGLTAAGIPFLIQKRLVRGLDYYTHTVFEFVSDALDAAQSTIGGGGRYDGLVAALGGKPTPGAGFGTGIERVLLACDAEGVFAPQPHTPSVFVVDTGDGSFARDLCQQLRDVGVAVDRAWAAADESGDLRTRSLKAQMKQAMKSQAQWCVIRGEDEAASQQVSLRDMLGDTPQQEVPEDEIFTLLRSKIQ